MCVCVYVCDCVCTVRLCVFLYACMVDAHSAIWIFFCVAAAERKRKSAKKDEDITLHPNPSVKVMEKDPLWETS